MNNKAFGSARDDLFNTERLCAALGSAAEGLSLTVLDVCDSTNNEAKRMAVAGSPSPAIIAANTQTAGRGRLGRSFYSPSQTGLYFSILYPTQAPLQSAVSLTGAAAVAVMRALCKTAGKQTAIKWVNDLYLEGKKVCGILAEALTGGSEVRQTYLIIGIGVNLSTVDFPTELSVKAGSVNSENVTRAELIAAIWRELSPYLIDPNDRSWLADYRAHSMVIGKEIEWSHGEERHAGIAVGITEDGALEVRLPNGEMTLLRTGEISVKVR